MQNQLELNQMMEERYQLELAPSDGVNRVADMELEKAMRLYKALKQQKDALEKQMALLKDQITVHMGDAVTLVSTEGELLATWNWSKPVVRFDTKRFKDEMPLIYNQYAVQGEPVRSFLVK